MPDFCIRVLLEPSEELAKLREEVSQLSASIASMRDSYSVLEHKYCLALEEAMMLRDKLKAKK